jgi:predicted SnoaL-like aldol condensation-catalyzing enzyme
MDNRGLVAQLVECWNTGKLEPIDKVLSPKFIRHEPEINGAATGREEYKQTIKRYRDLLPNFQTEATDIIEQGNKIAFRFKTTGKGGSGPVIFEGVNILRLEGDKIVEDWVYFDVEGLRDRLRRERAA